MMMPIRRPARSAMGAAMRAPKIVPTERKETTIDFCEVVIAQGVAAEALATGSPNVQSLESGVRGG